MKQKSSDTGIIDHARKYRGYKVLLIKRKNYISRLIITNILILLVFQQFAFTQVNQQSKSKNKTSKLFKKYQLAERKPFKPGDGLYIDTTPDSTSFFNRVIPIDDMGYAEFPVIGRVAVSGMSSEELTEFVKLNFHQYLRTSNIYVKPMLRASILGGVPRPGLYYVDYHSSLWEVVRRAGGTVHEEGIKDMVWERDRDEVVDDLIPYFEKGVSLKNMGFKSGDQIWTPSPGESFWDQFRTDVIPIMTFATSMVMLYFTYQTQALTASYRR